MQRSGGRRGGGDEARMRRRIRERQRRTKKRQRRTKIRRE